MPYLIDGNNLLGLRPEVIAREPGARGRLVQRLADFARARRTRVVVVFDGQPDAGGSPSGMALGDVSVQFAGRDSDADRRILKILDEADDPAGFILVTSDKALGDRARQRRARVVTSLRFRRTLDETPVPGDGPGGALTPEQIAEWEAWFREPRK